MPKKIYNSLLLPGVLVAFVVLWELTTKWLAIPRYLVPSPSDVWVSFVSNWDSIVYHAGFTLSATLAGFGLSVAVGVPLAVLIVYSKPLERILYPMLVASQAIPKVAIAPLLLVWLGYGSAPKIVVAFLIAFFPVVVNTASGLSQVSGDMLRLAASMGMKPLVIFRKMRFPLSVPEMMSGFKIAITLAVVGAVVGEFVGSREGLGYLIMVGTGNFDTPIVFACIIALTIIGVSLFYIIVFIDKRLSWWSKSEDSDGIPAMGGDSVTVLTQPTETKYGTKWPSPFSFTHSFVRYAGQMQMKVNRTRWDIDDEGRGLATYEARLGGRIFTLIVASHMIDQSRQQDRIIATEWDATSTLIDGEPTDVDLVSVFEEVPNVLWGRASRRTLVWSRANRSARLFDHTVSSLAAGKQPDSSQLAAIGYLFRTTGFSANGRNGMIDYAALVETGHVLRGSYHAQMLAAYMWREFSVDLAEHMARCINSEAVRLAEDAHRYIGIGNSSGIGLAPFVLRHPVLIDHWTSCVESALEVALDLELSGQHGETSLRLALHSILNETVQHFRELPSGTFEHFTPGDSIAAELRIAQRELLAVPSRGTIADFMRRIENLTSLESREAINSVILELTADVDEADRLDEMTADESFFYEPSVQCGVMLRLLQEHFGWALGEPVASRRGDYYFWYFSEEHMEPRRGEPGEDPGEEYGIPLDVMGRLQLLHSVLKENDLRQSIAELLIEKPDLHYIVCWVQTMVNKPNALTPTDFLSRDFLPLDVMRFQLAIYGMLKMRPSSRNWLRGTILQGAPLPSELGQRSMPMFPVAPILVGEV